MAKDNSTEKRGRGRPRDPALDTAILDAARDVVVEEGCHGFTLQAVAARAGVPKTTVYRRWGSREEMLRAAVRHLGGEDAEVPDTGSLTNDLVMVVQARIANLGTIDGALARIAMEATEEPELQRIVRDEIQRRRRTHFVILQRAIARGELDASIDFDAALDLVFGTVWSRYIASGTVHPAEARPMVERALSGLRAGDE